MSREIDSQMLLTAHVHVYNRTLTHRHTAFEIMKFGPSLRPKYSILSQTYNAASVYFYCYT